MNNGKYDKEVYEKVIAGLKAREYKRIVVLVGAGISVAAGIPDFRSPGTGLYYNLQKYNLPWPEAIFDIDYFQENPKPFYTLSKELYPGNFTPTKTHFFIKLLSDNGLLQRCYTQNIDTLEDVAKIPQDKLVFAHGSFTSAHCIKCHKKHSCEFVRERIFKDETPTCESCGSLVKPDIVFFGESLPMRFFYCMDEDFPVCDLLIIMGTGLMVHPFANLLYMVDENVPRILINLVSAGAFAYDSPGNTRDVFIKATSDDASQMLADVLGIGDDLREASKTCVHKDLHGKNEQDTSADADLKAFLKSKAMGITKFLSEEEKERLRKDAGEAPEDEEEKASGGDDDEEEEEAKEERK